MRSGVGPTEPTSKIPVQCLDLYFPRLFTTIVVLDMLPPPPPPRVTIPYDLGVMSSGGSPGSPQRNVNSPPHPSQWKNPRTLEGITPKTLVPGWFALPRPVTLLQGDGDSGGKSQHTSTGSWKTQPRGKSNEANGSPINLNPPLFPSAINRIVGNRSVGSH
ncbi:hypothetical protein N7512_006581 [Penicillium capsulatum]|nr:hypothetical protein N7512_006581 [Penicillium capsulatum]